MVIYCNQLKIISQYRSQNISSLAFNDGLTNAGYYKTPRGNELRYAHFKSPMDGPKNSGFFCKDQ